VKASQDWLFVTTTMTMTNNVLYWKCYTSKL